MSDTTNEQSTSQQPTTTNNNNQNSGQQPGANLPLYNAASNLKLMDALFDNMDSEIKTNVQNMCSLPIPKQFALSMNRQLMDYFSSNKEFTTAVAASYTLGTSTVPIDTPAAFTPRDHNLRYISACPKLSLTSTKQKVNIPTSLYGTEMMVPMTYYYINVLGNNTFATTDLAHVPQWRVQTAMNKLGTESMPNWLPGAIALQYAEVFEGTNNTAALLRAQNTQIKNFDMSTVVLALRLNGSSSKPFTTSFSVIALKLMLILKQYLSLKGDCSGSTNGLFHTPDWNDPSWSGPYQVTNSFAIGAVGGPVQNVFPYYFSNALANYTNAQFTTLNRFMGYAIGDMAIPAAFTLMNTALQYDDTAVVFVKSAMLAEPVILAAWVLAHLEHPFSFNSYSSTSYDYSSVAVAADGGGMLPVSNFVRVQGPKQRVLFVVLDRNDNAFTGNAFNWSVNGVATNVPYEGIGPGAQLNLVLQAAKSSAAFPAAVTAAMGWWWDMYGSDRDWHEAHAVASGMTRVFYEPLKSCGSQTMSPYINYNAAMPDDWIQNVGYGVTNFNNAVRIDQSFSAYEHGMVPFFCKNSLGQYPNMGSYTAQLNLTTMIQVDSRPHVTIPPMDVIKQALVAGKFWVSDSIPTIQMKNTNASTLANSLTLSSLYTAAATQILYEEAGLPISLEAQYRNDAYAAFQVDDFDQKKLTPLLRSLGAPNCSAFSAGSKVAQLNSGTTIPQEIARWWTVGAGVRTFDDCFYSKQIIPRPVIMGLCNLPEKETDVLRSNDKITSYLEQVTDIGGHPLLGEYYFQLDTNWKKSDEADAGRWIAAKIDRCMDTERAFPGALVVTNAQTLVMTSPGTNVNNTIVCSVPPMRLLEARYSFPGVISAFPKIWEPYALAHNKWIWDDVVATNMLKLYYQLPSSVTTQMVQKDGYTAALKWFWSDEKTAPARKMKPTLQFAGPNDVSSLEGVSQ